MLPAVRNLGAYRFQPRRAARRGFRPILMLSERRGSIMLEILLASVIIGLVAAGLLTALLGANRSARQAGQYAAAAALAQSIIEEMRLLPAGDPRLEPGAWDWCPPECPPRIRQVTVVVGQPAGFPEKLYRVEVLVERTGSELPVQVISYVRK